MATDLSEIHFKGDNPGAVRYGNFINYYQFHPAANRMKTFPTDIWRVANDGAFVCLDIGCNAGDLTVALLQFFTQNVCQSGTKCNFLGIDIDPTLITRAREYDRIGLEFQCVDIMNDAQTEKLTHHLNTFCQPRFNVAFCFSITMWIHLNHGDVGLKRFLAKVCDLSQMVVVEPQPWKCYRTAVKRLKLCNAEFPLFGDLVHRHDVETFIERVLEEDCCMVKVAETPASTWGRRILVYERRA